MRLFGGGDPKGYGSSEEHLREELQRVGGIVRAQLLRFRHALPEEHRERFWHLTDGYLESLAGDDEMSPLDSYRSIGDVGSILEWVAERRRFIDRRIEATDVADLRLARLKADFRLGAEEIDAFLLALLPFLHSTYRRLYGVLQYDPARAAATPSLVAEMQATAGADYATHLRAFDRGGTLRRSRLVVLGGLEADPSQFRPVLLDDRVIQFLLGRNEFDPQLQGVARWYTAAVRLRDLPLPREVMNRLEMLPEVRAVERQALARLKLEFSGPDAGLAVRAFFTVADGLGLPLLVVDAQAVPETGWSTVVQCALREAILRPTVVMFTGLGALPTDPGGSARMTELVESLTSLSRPAAIELGSSVPTDGRHGAQGWIPFHLPSPTVEQREQLWLRVIAGLEHRIDDPPRVAAELASAYQLTDSQIRDAALTAASLARRRHVFQAPVERDDLFAACRTQATKQLVAFATRIEPRRHLSLDDIVLPAASGTQLRELRSRIRNHERVYQVMELGDRIRLGRGVTALFLGGSGTGKTMAAEVLAAEKRVDLFRVDLAALVSKWVGETEKNLSRIFSDAEQANCMLFFDEADALFGQRGEVKEARDRWANLEVNYLLQRIEDFSGVVILATNFRQNIDEAFLRRIHVMVEFPMPDARSRRRIWGRLIPGRRHTTLTSAELDELADRFELSGGSIRNVVLSGCYRAMEEEDRKLTLRHLVAGTAREYQKAMRPVTPGEFGPVFYPWAMADVVAPVEPAPEPEPEPEPAEVA